MKEEEETTFPTKHTSPTPSKSKIEPLAPRTPSFVSLWFGNEEEDQAVMLDLSKCA